MQANSNKHINKKNMQEKIQVTGTVTNAKQTEGKVKIDLQSCTCYK